MKSSLFKLHPVTNGGQAGGGLWGSLDDHNDSLHWVVLSLQNTSAPEMLAVVFVAICWLWLWLMPFSWRTC